MHALVAQRAQPHDYLTSPATHMLSAANGDFGALSPLRLAEVLMPAEEKGRAAAHGP